MIQALANHLVSRSSKLKDQARHMSTLSKNYVALKPEAAANLGDLEDHILLTREDGILLFFDAFHLTLEERDEYGIIGAKDLEVEFHLHDFLCSLEPDAYLMRRAGGEFGSRGKWLDHPFLAEPSVAAIDEQYRQFLCDSRMAAPRSYEIQAEDRPVTAAIECALQSSSDFQVVDAALRSLSRIRVEQSLGSGSIIYSPVVSYRIQGGNRISLQVQYFEAKSTAPSSTQLSLGDLTS